MASLRTNSRLPVGSATWISEERASALQIADAEAEEFSFSARNELDWLNEHMAEIFSEDQLNVTEIFKTPGKLRGKTPRTARKRDLEGRAPLSDLFSATPKGAPSPFRQQPVERQLPKFQVAEDPVEVPFRKVQTAKPTVTRAANTLFFDSGYHGSQATVATEVDERTEMIIATQSTQAQTPPHNEQSKRHDTSSEERRTTEESFQSAKEEQTIAVTIEDSVAELQTAPKANPEPENQKMTTEIPQKPGAEQVPSPKVQVQKSSNVPQTQQGQAKSTIDGIHDVFEDVQSPSEDGSSPIRAPLVRKSSLTFASLPAREPLTTKQSIGNRTSRTSHLDQSRTSYFGRPTGGKSLGNVQLDDHQDDDDEMDVDLVEGAAPNRFALDSESKLTRMHNKTSTQRLQDQISMLGQSQSQAPRPSKSIPNMAAMVSQPAQVSQSQDTRQAPSPSLADRPFVAPGAFPEDEEDDWIGPPNAAAGPSIFSPRQGLIKTRSADVVESIQGSETSGVSKFNVPKQRRDDAAHRSPLREPAIPERTTSTLGHIKSASTSVLRSPTKNPDVAESMLKKGISVSNPNLASAIERDEPDCQTPKSPSRSFRDSPLKAAKDKVSSILKTSRNLFASSAAASAAAKGSTLSPPPMRLGHHGTPSLEDVLQYNPTGNSSLYPSLESLHGGMDSPSRLFGNGKAGFSTHVYDKKKEKDSKEARDAQKREEKLEKLREKETEKARAFSQQEQERVAAMERQILAKKEQEKLAKAVQMEPPRATRSSPRKTKAQLEAEGIAAAVPSKIITGKDIEMTDASAMPPPEIPRPAGSSQTANPREQIKRPVKPAKDSIHPSKQAPVVIRVDTGSQRNPQRNLFHPSNAALASSLQDSLAPTTSTAKAAGPPPAIKNKANSASVRPKASTSSLKSVSSTTGKVRALEAAAKKKEQEEQEAQRKRNNKLDMDRKRAALQEGKQLEQQRQHEAEKQREKEREHLASQVDPKKNAQRAMEKRMEVERAKQQKPPAPAPRPQPATDLAQTSLQDKPLPAPPAYRGELGQARPASRMEAATHRPEEDFGRSVNSTLQNTTKAPPKRPLQQDAGEESQPRPALQRNGPSNHAPDPKRRKTNEDHDQDMIDSQSKGHMAPPVRQSTIRQKDGPTKSLFPSGYTNAPQPSHAGPSLHKATLNAQHMHRAKPAHPMDMAQTSKAAINFAPNPTQAAAPHKTPARPAGVPVNAGKSSVKPSAKSSPRYQNGESIDLPEIPTDSEDEDSDDGGANSFPIPGWANSPALRQGLIIQEGMDPVSVFGLPGEIKLEEVFKNADRHPKFRARTSSANWSGSDRLTEDEVKRDLEARDRLRREGGWSYGLS